MICRREGEYYFNNTNDFLKIVKCYAIHTHINSRLSNPTHTRSYSSKASTSNPSLDTIKFIRSVTEKTLCSLR